MLFTVHTRNFYKKHIVYTGISTKCSGRIIFMLIHPYVWKKNENTLKTKLNSHYTTSEVGCVYCD